MKLVIIFFFYTISVSAQPLKYIPDENLRNEFRKLKLLTNDSLDIKKINVNPQFDLKFTEKGIENLDGIQYFINVWCLNISRNKIKRLNHLPPKVTDLDCSHNEITEIDTLPINLNRLDCSNNRINSIENLPNSLVSLDFGNNVMTRLPHLPKHLQFINYSNNLIPSNILPSAFQDVSCSNPLQNCLPYEMVKWKILNSVIKDTTLNITGMEIIVSSIYSWGFGNKFEIIDFKSENSKLVAEQIIIKKDHDISERKKDTAYFVKGEYIVDIRKLKNLIGDVYSNKLIIQIDTGNSQTTMNLTHKKNRNKRNDVLCHDCTSFGIVYKIYSQTDTINLEYGVDNNQTEGIVFSHNHNDPEDIQSILDWVYMYKLTNMTISDYWFTKEFFKRSYFDRIMKWVND